MFKEHPAWFTLAWSVEERAILLKHMLCTMTSLRNGYVNTLWRDYVTTVPHCSEYRCRSFLNNLKWSYITPIMLRELPIFFNVFSKKIPFEWGPNKKQKKRNPDAWYQRVLYTATFVMLHIKFKETQQFCNERENSSKNVTGREILKLFGSIFLLIYIINIHIPYINRRVWRITFEWYPNH